VSDAARRLPCTRTSRQRCTVCFGVQMPTVCMRVAMLALGSPLRMHSWRTRALVSMRRAVGLGDSGSVYLGVNLEFPGTPLNNSVSCLLHALQGTHMLIE